MGRERWKEFETKGERKRGKATLAVILSRQDFKLLEVPEKP